MSGNSKINLAQLKKHFNVNRKEATGFILMLLTLKEGESFSSVLGEIIKLKGNVFEINTTKSISMLVDLWCSETENPIGFEVFD